ncbi:MAG: hypothetical protein AUH43_14585 [Acidobacteria bacterium 13_1_40CM_65_14]|nr:MAG: hypothetical protein AUH43_14585 [Acidobacteria bacterium 13_1_40CM_65_14]
MRSTGEIVACCALSSAKSGTVLPFCSSAIASAVNLAFGASAVTSSDPVCPMTRVGWLIVTRGGAPRPAAMYATPAASARSTRSAASQRNMDPIIQVC